MGFRSAVCLVGLVALCGCSSTPVAPSNDYTAKFEKRVGANDQQAQLFVDALARLPADQRKPYVMSHEADARNLAKVANPDLQKRYQVLVRGSDQP